MALVSKQNLPTHPWGKALPRRARPGARLTLSSKFVLLEIRFDPVHIV
jgi:hypothetical protein